MKDFNKVIPYVIAIVFFALASIIYFHPLLKGQKINQSDITQFRGMVKDINDFRDDKNTEPYWTGASFSGMPAYQVSAYYPEEFFVMKRYLQELIVFFIKLKAFILMSMFLLLT